MKRVVVKRDRWIRGQGSKGSYLFRPSDTHMCCWGFICHAFGAPLEQLAWRRIPEEAGNYTGLQDLIAEHPTEVTRMLDFNDREKLSQDRREEQLTADAAAMGIELVFED